MYKKEKSVLRITIWHHEAGDRFFYPIFTRIMHIFSCSPLNNAFSSYLHTGFIFFSISVSSLNVPVSIEGLYAGLIFFSFSSKKKQKKPKRADPKDLRHEDSSAVWNELAYFKNENRNLVTERYALIR